MTVNRADELVLNLGLRGAVQSAVGAVIFLGFGGSGVYAAFTGHVVGAPPVAVGIVGGLFALPGVLFVVGLPVLARSRKLIVNAAGIDYQDPRGAGFTVRWEELAQVALSCTTKGSGVPGSPLALRTRLVRLVLVPCDAAFAQRHPKMNSFWRGDHYRMPFGQAPVLLRKLHAALPVFAGSRYIGAYEEGTSLSII